MINLDDREKIISKYEIDKRVIFYHCTSEYPCPFEHLFLNVVKQKSQLSDDNWLF